ncbi:response regulator [Cohnella herbarum]|nr:response regulator [Cohnella herbarum]
MKLLLVEDERLTREGIRNDIAWERLGIMEVMEATDGVHALSITEQFCPDIVLTDIRMPRMDGVGLATELRRNNPRCKIIFMSGYADKEYLKAAISLKAVSYVEKPIDIDELREALESAAILCAEERRHLEREAAAKETMEASRELVKQEIALRLIGDAYEGTLLNSRLEIAEFPLSLAAPCVTVLLKIVAPQPSPNHIIAIVETCISTSGLRYLFAAKNELHSVLHLFGSERAPLDPFVLRNVCHCLSSELNGHYDRYSITAGDIVDGYVLLIQSYTSAVVRMQEAFYRPPCSIATSDYPVAPPSESDNDAKRQVVKEMHEALRNERFAELEALIRRLTDFLRQRPDELVSATKEIFYRFMLEMDGFANQRGIALFPLSAETDQPWELLLQCHYLEDAEDAVLLKMRQLMEAVTSEGKGGMASRIMKYIHEHYADESLSVGEISERMEMTSSHLIAVFKESTGTTIKQYLMEYRVEKAKQLLTGDRLKIFDVASQVGYKDGEYFAKIFRKFTGLTPSAYRERFRL